MAVWEKSPAYPVRIYVNLVRGFGWKYIFIANTWLTCHMKTEHRQSSRQNQGQSVLANKRPTHLGSYKKHVPSRPHAPFLHNTENETECTTLVVSKDQKVFGHNLKKMEVKQ
jgi:hypothetical protein